MSLELRLLTPNQDPVYVEARFDRVRDQKTLFDISAEGVYVSESPSLETFVGTLGVARDITERKQTERELNDYRQRLEQMAKEQTRELREANERLRREIEDREAVQKALSLSEEKYRRLADNAQDEIFRLSLPEARYEYISPAVERLTGYAPEEYYRRPDLYREVIHPAWKPHFDLEWKKIVSGEAEPEYEFKIVHKSGEDRWLHQRNVTVKDEQGRPVALEGIVTDVTERRHMEESLKKSEAFNKGIIQSSRDCILVLDLEAA